jgi:hypothetical protein
MALVTGPLHSESARGQFAKTTIYQMRGGKCIAKRYAAPVEPNSSAQQAVKLFTGDTMKRWPALTDEQRATWLPLALQRNVEPINVYLDENWKRRDRGLPVTDTWPPAADEFDPMDYGTAVFWLDPTRGITTSLAGNVTTWQDQIALASVSQIEDTFAITPAAGPPAGVAFPDTNDALLSLGSEMWYADEPRTIVVAYKRDNTVAIVPLAGQFNASASTAFLLETWPDSPGGDPHLTGYEDDADFPAAPTTDWTIAAARFTGTLVTLTRNRTLGTPSAHNLYTTITPFGLGYLETPTTPETFTIGDVLIYGSALANTPLAALLDALCTRYGITP